MVAEEEAEAEVAAITVADATAIKPSSGWVGRAVPSAL